MLIIFHQKRAEEVAGPLDAVGDQFYNEMTKREIGRKKCKVFIHLTFFHFESLMCRFWYQEAGCTHFIAMDSDEFYIFEQLENAKKLIVAHNYDATACRYVNASWIQGVYTFLL